MGIKCGDLISVVLVGIRCLSHVSVVPIADLIQDATRPSTRSASLMFKHPVLRLVAETSPLPTSPRSVSTQFWSPAIIRSYGFHVVPSMFGRDLIEQVRADAKGEERHVPVIVEKCIDAVDTLGELAAPFGFVS